MTVPGMSHLALLRLSLATRLNRFTSSPRHRPTSSSNQETPRLASASSCHQGRQEIGWWHTARVFSRHIQLPSLAKIVRLVLSHSCLQQCFPMSESVVTRKRWNCLDNEEVDHTVDLTYRLLRACPEWDCFGDCRQQSGVRDASKLAKVPSLLLCLMHPLCCHSHAVREGSKIAFPTRGIIHHHFCASTEAIA